ncbi:hypothetical protein CEP52_012394 [Fusarium oligoseptatum]|uniref:Uncharacterized protein n=1 Tax=Fusarium oligoseptatum TaxID=2604345 RepID=A0A428SYL3_9HYPO|nr:hypothetical protein CEP52_012394 [Fusarium oligoseptatum]
MDSRSKDLVDLLYDFIGVTILLMATVALLLGILSFLASAKDYFSKLHLVSPSTENIGLGLRTLGYGAVGVVECVPLMGFFMLVYVTVSVIRDLRSSHPPSTLGRQLEEDIERDFAQVAESNDE